MARAGGEETLRGKVACGEETLRGEVGWGEETLRGEVDWGKVLVFDRRNTSTVSHQPDTAAGLQCPATGPSHHRFLF